MRDLSECVDSEHIPERDEDSMLQSADLLVSHLLQSSDNLDAKLAHVSGALSKHDQAVLNALDSDIL